MGSTVSKNVHNYIEETINTKVLGFDPAQFMVHGHVRAGFEPVKDLFEENFIRGKEENSQLCVYYKGEKVVDLWGGRDESFTADTLLTVFSSSKSLTAIVVAILVDRGHLAYSQLIADIWPEFTGGGKEKAKVADLMRHELGLPAFSESLPASSLLPHNIKNNHIGRIIEKEKLKSRPGTERDYHFFTRGWIANEVVRRADPKGRTIGEILREELSDKLGADAYIGLEDQKLDQTGKLTIRSILDVVAKVSSGAEENVSITALVPVIGRLAYSMMTSKEPSLPPPIEDIPIFRLDRLVQFFNHSPQVEMPSANAYCSARGLAKIGALMANRGNINSIQILSPAGWASMHSNPTEKMLFGALNTRFSRGGVNIISSEEEDEEKSEEPEKDQLKQMMKYLTGFVGWMGLGGSIFQWQPRKQVGFAYVPSLIDWTDLANMKGMKLQASVMQCIERIEGNSVLWLDNPTARQEGDSIPPSTSSPSPSTPSPSPCHDAIPKSKSRDHATEGENEDSGDLSNRNKDDIFPANRKRVSINLANGKGEYISHTNKGRDSFVLTNGKTVSVTGKYTTRVNIGQLLPK